MFVKVTHVGLLLPSILTDHSKVIMLLDKDLKQHSHDGCPNRHHCKKNDEQCCYLVKGDCIIGEYDEY